MTEITDTIKLKNVDFDQLNFSEKRKKRSALGVDNVFLSYGKDNSWAYIQFPMLKHPFDLPEKLIDDGSTAITLSLNKNIESHRVAIEKLRKFDAVVLDNCHEHAPEWLSKGTVVDDSCIARHYTHLLQLKTSDEDPTEERYFNIKVKLPAKEGKIITESTDMKDNEVDPLTNLTKHYSVQVIARPSRLWFQASGKVGTTWEVRHPSICPARHIQTQRLVWQRFVLMTHVRLAVRLHPHREDRNPHRRTSVDELRR